jgi:asparagine synthase (glutamine-hydrolysing)
MCGICGKLLHDQDGVVADSLIRDMTAALAHRGPDDEGYYVAGRIGLGQRRLSIVDVAGGRQPIANEDGAVWIIFNGEIYNHLEIRAYLEARGHRYKTRCDTETILHAYEEFGPDCVRRLRGMFAFAIWDAKDQTLFAARDRFGIKPFYYWQGASGFAFASEMKSLLLDPDLEVTPDPVALYDYFTFKYIPGPNTPWREIKRLQPAHWLVVKDGQVRRQRYWVPEFRGLSRRSAEEHLEELEALLKASIRDHMMSEVPQGVFLSGGVDSSLIVHLMSEVCNEPIRTFSITFTEHPDFDEAGYARQVADACHTQHHVYNCTPDAIATLPDIFWHIEEPLADAAAIPLHELCRQATRHVTVVHCGDGGDEGFAGYPRFYWDQYAPSVARIPEGIRQHMLAPMFQWGWRLPEPFKEFCRRGEKFCKFAALPAAERYLNWFTPIPDNLKAQMLNPDLLKEVAPHRSADVFRGIFADAAALGLDPLGAKQYCELSSFIPDDLMLKSDKVAMSAGLEGRFPFLDDRLVEFGLSLPPDQKMTRTQLKLPLRRLLARHMSYDFVHRRKHGFEVPVTRWFKDSLQHTLRETIEESQSLLNDVLDLKYLRRMIESLQGNDPAVGRQLFTVFMFQRWRALFRNPKQLCRERLAANPSRRLAGGS